MKKKVKGMDRMKHEMRFGDMTAYLLDVWDMEDEESPVRNPSLRDLLEDLS